MNPVAAIDTDNYALIRTLTTQVSGTTTKTTEQFGFNTNESGFYLAIRDLGTCILISRLIVFYNACPGETVNLVMRPETIAPIVGSNIQLNVNASCFANSSLEGDAFLLKCLESGNWVAVKIYPPLGVSAILDLFLPWTEKTVCVSMTTCFSLGHIIV